MEHCSFEFQVIQVGFWCYGGGSLVFCVNVLLSQRAGIFSDQLMREFKAMDE